MSVLCCLHAGHMAWISGGMRTLCYEAFGATAVSPDSLTVAYAVKEHGQWHLGKIAPLPAPQHLRDGTIVPKQPYELMEYPRGQAFEEMGTPVISPDSARIAVPTRMKQRCECSTPAGVGT